MRVIYRLTSNISVIFKKVLSQPEKAPAWPRWAHWLVLTMLITGGIGITLSFYYITYDDVFLAFRYAHNIVHGQGFVFNPGEHFLGTPAPLFVGLLVVFKMIFPWLTIPEWGGILSGLALLGCSIFLYLLGKAYHQPFAGTFTAVLTLFSPFVVMTLGGETPIYLMLVCAAFYAYARERYNLCAFLLALAMLNRSEGIVVVGVLGIHFLLTQKRLPWKPILVLALTLAPWLIYATIQFGSPLTHSLAAKIAQRRIGLAPFIPSAAYWVRHIVLHNNPWSLVAVPLVGLGGIIGIRQWRHWGALFGWIIAQSIAYLILDVPFYHWYIAHLGVGLALAIGLGVEGGVNLLTRGASLSSYIHGPSLASRSVRVAGIAILISFACAIIILSVWSVRWYHWGQPNPANRLYVKIGLWLKKNTPPSSSVAYIEIGQIGYYSERRIVDLLGLVSPGVSEHLKQGNFLWAYQFYQPDYVLYNPLFAGWMHPVVAQPWFQEAYEIVGQIEQDGYPFPITVYRKKEGASFPLPVEVDIAQLRFEKPIRLYADHPVGQTFKAHASNLCGVEVLFATFGHENLQPVTFYIINASDSSRTLVHQVIPPSSVMDNAWFGVFFPPIPNSKDQLFSFYIGWSGAMVAEDLAIWSSNGDSYPLGTAILDGQSADYDLAFKTYICPDPTMLPK